MPVLQVDPERFSPADLEPAARWLEAGRVVAFPTETFYGLAVDPRSASGVALLFELKGRPTAMALPLVAASTEAVERWCGPLTPLARRLAAAFWPGPLSLLVDVRERLAPGVAGADGSVAVRVPGHAVALALAEVWGGPVTATSANISGSAPACRSGDLGAIGRDSRVLVLDGGETAGGRPSTIVDARGDRPTLVREGVVPWSRVLESSH